MLGSMRCGANLNKKTISYDWAIADYTQAIRLDPKFANAYNGRGNVYQAKGDAARANADFARARQLDPNLGN